MAGEKGRQGQEGGWKCETSRVLTQEAREASGNRVHFGKLPLQIKVTRAPRRLHGVIYLARSPLAHRVILVHAVP